MLTKQDKQKIIDAYKSIDVKKFEIEHTDERMVKWFRFGSYNAMQIAIEIIKEMPERKVRQKTNEYK